MAYTDRASEGGSASNFCSGEQHRKSRLLRVLKANLKYIMCPMATKETEMMTSRPKASGLGARMTMTKCRRSRR